MPGFPLDWTPVDDLLETLKDAGIRQASVDPAELSLPGVWVQVTGIAQDRLGGSTIQTRLVLVVPDNGIRRSMAALADLYNDVLEVLDPDGDATPLTVSLTEGGRPLPALALPFNLPT